MRKTMKKLTQGATRLLVLALGLGLVSTARATDYTYSNVDSDSLAVKSDGKFGTTSFSFQLNNPSANAATADFPASGYVQLTKISIGARSDNGSQSVTTATLTNNKTSESYAATVTYSSGNDFTAVKPDSWSRKEVKITFGTDGVLVDTTATYTLTFKNAEGTTTTLGYSVVTTVASNQQTTDWKPAMRIYGRTPSGSMEMPSSLIPSSGGMALPSTVTVADATGMAFANDSVTIGNSGIQIALGSGLQTLTVMVKAIIPSSGGRLVGWYMTSDYEGYLSYTGSKFEQRFLNKGTASGVYGDISWTRDANEHWCAVSYDRASDTSSYLDGGEDGKKVTSTSLKFKDSETSSVTIGGTAYNMTDTATGMVIKDVQIYNQSLGYQRIAKVTTALNNGWTADQTGVTVSGVKVPSLGGDIEAGAVTGTATIGTDGAVTYTDSSITELYAGGADSGSTVDGNATLRIKSASSFNTGITLNTGYATGTKALVFDGGATLHNPVIGDFDSISGSIANLYLTGSSLTIGDGVDLEVTTMLRTAQASSPSDCSITQTGGSLTCSGPANDGYKLGAFVLSHYPKITTYTLSGGTLTVSNSQAKFGADGTGNMTISGTGVANFHSLSLRRGTLTVAAGGTLNLGAVGQTAPVSRDYGSLTLNGGTMGAWNSSAITISVPVAVSGNSIIRASTATGDAATIIFTGAITGSGNLTITGGGKVVFASDMSGFTGSFAVTSGTLEVPSGVSVTSVAAGAEVVVKTSTSPASLEAAISGGYSLSGSLAIPETVGGTLTFVDSSGNAVLNPSSTWENDVRTFTGTAPVNGIYTGDKWWWDYEFNGNVTSIGSDTGGMDLEGSGASYTAVDSSGNQELYFQKTPYRSATFSNKDALTAVMYCQPGNYANSVLVGFGTTYNPGVAVALVTGDHPDLGEMKLVLIQRSGNTVTVTSLADLTAVGAIATKHLYAFVIDRITENETTKTRIRVYLDGKVKAIYKHNGTLNLTDGFQIGSLYGGVKATDSSWDTGLVKYSATGNSGTLDFLRVIDGSLSDGAMAILANTYPYESAHGEATRDPLSGSANTWVYTDAWTQMVPGEDDATQNAPNADTNVKLSIDGDSAVSVALNLASDSNYESLSLTKEAGATGSLKITSNVGNQTYGKLASAETSVLVDTTVPAGRARLGITSVGDGVTLTVDPMTTTISDVMSGLAFGGVYEDTVISMALLGDGASVVLDSTGVSTLAGYGFTAELVYNPNNLSYTFRLTREAATADIAVHVFSGGTVTWSTRSIPVPAPASLPSSYTGTVTITNESENPVTIATAFAGGNVTVASGGPVTLSGAITTSGTVALNTATTLSGNTVSCALTGSGAVTINDTVTIADGGSIANTINGSGTIDCSGRSSKPGAFTFGTWTGTVVLPELASIAGDTFSFNNYGIEGSTVRVNGIGGGWLKNEEVNPTIDIPVDKTLTISDFSASFNNTFKALSGAGTFAVTYNTAIDTTSGSWYSNYSAYFLVKNASNFTGSLTTTTPGIVIGSAKPEYRTAGGKIMLTTSATIAAGKTWTATDGIVLADAAATLTNTDGALDPAPTTTVANSYVKLTGSTYSVDAYNTVAFTVANATVTRTDVLGNAIKDGDTITFTVAPDANYGVSSVTATSGEVTNDGGTYSYVVTSDATITVEIVRTHVQLTIPVVEHATATVTVGGETASGSSPYTVPYQSNVTVTWTPASGYKITSGATQTINSIAADTTVDSPMVEEVSAAVSNVNFTYGADYTTAEVTATITGDATSATLTYGGNTYNAQVSNGTATFTDVAVSRDSGNIYAPVSYIITTDAHATTGGTGSAVVADTTSWFSQSSANSGAPVGGLWATEVNLSTPTNVTDNSFTATERSTTSCVKMEFNVCFTATSDGDVSGEAQGALKLGEVNDATTFMVLTNGNQWAAVSSVGLTPDPAATYKVVMTFNYANNTYSVSVDDLVLTNSTGSSSFPLAASRTYVQTIDFAGSGTLVSMKGDQLEGYMVKDGEGNWYATIQAAINAYNSANGPYTVLHDGTAPDGWKIDETTKALVKLAKGFFFMAY